MKKMIFPVLLMGLSLHAQARSYARLTCQTSNPCAYANDMHQRCVRKIVINGMNGAASETVNYSPKDIGSEVYFVPAEYDVVAIAHTEGVVFQDSTGDQKGELTYLPNGKLNGQIQLDRDFKFNVVCTVDQIELE